MKWNGERERTSKKAEVCAFLCCTPELCECVVVVVIKHLLLRCFRFYGGQNYIFLPEKKLHEFLYILKREEKNIFSVKRNNEKKNGNEREIYKSFFKLINSKNSFSPRRS